MSAMTPARRRAIPAIVVLALIGILPHGSRADDAPATSPASTTQPLFTRRADVIYGRKDGTALTMDVLTPSRAAGIERNGAGVILVVSGGWLSSHESLDSPFMSIFYAPFIKRGYVVFAVVHGSQPRYTIPEIRLDLNRAVRYIRARAAEWQINPQRLGITGGSAGGHLSLLQGCGPLKPDPDAKDEVDRYSSAVQAVACLFPPTDFLNWGDTHINALDVPTIKPFMAAFDFREFSPTTHMYERITDRIRVAQIEKEISPITHVSKGSPPTLIIHGDADTLVPIQQSKIIIEKLKEAKVPCELSIRTGKGHGWMDAQGDLQKMADWFDTYLVSEKK